MELVPRAQDLAQGEDSALVPLRKELDAVWGGVLLLPDADEASASDAEWGDGAFRGREAVERINPLAISNKKLYCAARREASASFLVRKKKARILTP